MSTLTEVRTALQEALADVTTANAYSYFPEPVTVPALVVGGPRGTFNDSTETDEYLFPVTVVCTDQKGDTTELDGFLASSGGTSVRAAIQADDTLGGVVEYALVVGMRDYGIVTIQGAEYQSAVLDVRVVVLQ